ncbi:uncharacterized protein LOC106011640 [Aplysia californica]|uniref:Uncharacterized protein LOC106011640 n=1 Tax=Aplysia californica TaxID=6500 RepID=A0ABM0ZYZ2_APLCA|nr:uncharacterized protein LOC106011640 [Aplysia californica]
MQQYTLASMEPDLASKVCSRLSEAWSGHPGEHYPDFLVEVDQHIFPCHRFILAATSGFFRGLLRSNMKETLDKKTRIYGISESTFRLILDRIYCSKNVITGENVIELWQAANQLDIDFLVAECEDFVMSTLSFYNWYNTYVYARHLCSARVSKSTWAFMLAEFDTIVQGHMFLNLSPEDVCGLLNSDVLLSASEDKVIIAVLKWVLNDSLWEDCPPQREDQKAVAPGTRKDRNETRYLQSSEKLREEQRDIDNVERLCQVLSETHKQSTCPDKMLTADSSLSSADVESSASSISGICDVSGGESSSAAGRIEHLCRLVCACRPRLASDGCLRALMNMPLVMVHQEARDKVLEAVADRLMAGGKKHRHRNKRRAERRCAPGTGIDSSHTKTKSASAAAANQQGARIQFHNLRAGSRASWGEWAHNTLGMIHRGFKDF